MQVKLKVIGGKNDGREIKISVPEFVIGRGEGAHLRPQSDLISRKHTAILVVEGKVICKDLGSRNGSYVNGERVEGERQLKVGDRLRVGRLQFEVLIDLTVAGAKKPRVEGVKEAAARAAKLNSGSVADDDSINDWLSDEQAQDAVESETRQYRFDETSHITSPDNSATIDGDSQDTEAINLDTDSGDEKANKKKKKEYGKLPDRGRADSIDSRDAASQMLKKFFNRR